MEEKIKNQISVGRKVKIVGDTAYTSIYNGHFGIINNIDDSRVFKYGVIIDDMKSDEPVFFADYELKLINE